MFSILLLISVSACDFLKGADITSPALDNALNAMNAIGISGGRFNMAGGSQFLLGISYYGALGISDTSKLTQDLDDMAKYRFNWLRVWAIWDYTGEDVSAVSASGSIRSTYMERLKTLIIEAGKRGIVVDVTIARDARGGIFPSDQSDHVAVVATLASELQSYPNWYFDVANECNFHDFRYVSPQEVGDLITTVKSIDSERMCTASSTHISEQELEDYITIGKIDFASPHLDRESDNPSAVTMGTVVSLANALAAAGEAIPIHLQEPFRRGYVTATHPTGAAYPAGEFVADLDAARLSGASGWCFHNGAWAKGAPWKSFNMGGSEKRLFEQLDEEEMKAIRQF